MRQGDSHHADFVPPRYANWAAQWTPRQSPYSRPDYRNIEIFLPSCCPSVLPGSMWRTSHRVKHPSDMYSESTSARGVIIRERGLVTLA